MLLVIGLVALLCSAPFLLWGFYMASQESQYFGIVFPMELGSLLLGILLLFVGIGCLGTFFQQERARIPLPLRHGEEWHKELDIQALFG